MNAITLHHGVDDIERMARAFAVSKLFGVTNPEQAVALCLIAQAEGRHPASAAQDYHIIQGKPSKKADAMLRDFLAAGGKVEWHKLDDTIADATFSHPAGGSVRITWDMARAAKAQLKTPMWTKFPRQMLRARVVSEGVRTVFPMATSGMYVPEEVQEFDAPRAVAEPPANTTANLPMIDGEVIIPDEPKQLSKAKARPIDGEMRRELDACGTVEELGRVWSSAAFQTELKRMPTDWQRMLEEHKDELKADLAARPMPPVAGYVEPDFSEMEGQFT